MKFRQAVGHGFAARVGHCALRAVPMLVLALGLLGCAGSERTSAKPTMISEIMPLVGSTNVIHVVPVEGLDRPLQLVLADTVAASLRDINRPALLSAVVNDRGPTVRGRIEKLRERGSIVWVSAVWQLLAPYGTAVAEEKREVVIDKHLWDQQAVEVINLLIRESMTTIAEMVADHVGPLNVTETVEMAATPTQIVNEPATVMPRAPMVQGAKKPPTPDPAPPMASKMSTDPTPPVTTEEVAKVVDVLADVPADVPAKTEPDEAPSTPASHPPVSLTPKDSDIASKLATEPETPIEQPIAAPDSGTTFDLRTQERTQEMSPPETEMGQPKPTEIDAPPPKMMAVEPPISPESKILEAGISMPQRDAAVLWGRPSFLIRPVRGAPGDGNAALTSAIKAALRSRDLTITEDPRQAGYEVIGNVNVGISVNGRQRAKISWTVNTIGGDEVGKAVQENIIAAGSLDGPWGRVSEIVSVAAADGIQALFNAPKRKVTSVGYVPEFPEFPKIPKLPRMPGRALPPAAN